MAARAAYRRNQVNVSLDETNMSKDDLNISDRNELLSRNASLMKTPARIDSTLSIAFNGENPKVYASKGGGGKTFGRLLQQPSLLVPQRTREEKDIEYAKIEMMLAQPHMQQVMADRVSINKHWN